MGGSLLFKLSGLAESTDLSLIILGILISSSPLSLSAWKTKISTCANSVDPDETACHEPSHQELHCLPFCSFFFFFFCYSFKTETLFASVDKSKFKSGSTSETQG